MPVKPVANFGGYEIYIDNKIRKNVRLPLKLYKTILLLAIKADIKKIKVRK